MVKTKYSYRKSIEEIEAILVRIESEETDIDNLTAEIKRASLLLQECKQKLLHTEQELGKVLQSFE